MENIPQLIIQWILLTFMLIGLFGMIIPIFPGILIIWLAAVTYLFVQLYWGAMGGWAWFLFVMITIFAIIGSVVDNIIIARKLRDTGTPWSSIAIGYTAGLISSFFLTPFAALLITPAGMYAAEYRRLRDKRKAFDSTKAWMIGFGWSFIALFIIGAIMILLWLLWAWFL
jgi:hypothetical protein